MASRPGNTLPKSSAGISLWPAPASTAVRGVAVAATSVLAPLPRFYPGCWRLHPGSSRRRPKRSPIEPESINRLARVSVYA